MKTLLFAFSLFFVLGCAASNKSGGVFYPDWVYGAPKGDKICYVGSSIPHIKGSSYQRALAISRGIEGIARQKKITVDVDVEHLLYGSSSSATSQMSVYSVQTTRGETVKAVIKEVWINPKTDELFASVFSDVNRFFLWRDI